MHDVAESGNVDVIADALRHEDATAAIYRELSSLTPMPVLKQTYA